jgi:nitroreductase
MDNKEIVDIAQNRCAIKTFDKKRIISDTDFDMLLEVARYSPSSFGLEPWYVKIVQNPEIREAMKPYISGGQRQIDTCSHFVIFTVTTLLSPDSEYFKHINKDVKGFDDDAYDAFVSRFKLFQEQKLGLTNERSEIDWAGKQAYIALGNMVLAAAICGIDSCAIEGFIPNEIDSILSQHNFIEENKEHTAVMAAFGYRDEEPTRKKTRRPMNEIAKYIC